MKLHRPSRFVQTRPPAAFRRLCVETNSTQPENYCLIPAAFRRLCVETPHSWHRLLYPVPAAFRRLCVETKYGIVGRIRAFPAAFRRLCVETAVHTKTIVHRPCQPPSGGCVLKPARRWPSTALCGQPPSGGCVLKLLYHKPKHLFLPTSRLQAAVC